MRDSYSATDSLCNVRNMLIHAVTYECMWCYSERQASADLCNGMSTNWRLYPGTQLASRLSSTLQILSSHFVGSSLLTRLRYDVPMCRQRTWPRSPFSVALSTILPDVHSSSGVVVWMGQGLNRGNPGDLRSPTSDLRYPTSDVGPPPLISDPHHFRADSLNTALQCTIWLI